MKNIISTIIAAAAGMMLINCCDAVARPNISLHPTNPRYFLFRGKPTVLITSAEHYGAVLNLDFPHKPYLDELKRSGLNYTRIFTGAYCENPREFNIQHNTLAPAEGKLICPWARSEKPGYAMGGAKFDLTKWDEAYFARLKSFIKEAGRRGIVVEIAMFCTFYSDSLWKLSPIHITNNVNGVGDAVYTDVCTLKHLDLTRVQEDMTRKIVSELKDFDNVIYEICNEPYFNGVTLEWQKHIAAVIAETETAFPNRHLIAQNINNGTKRVMNPDPNVSILNFHYAYPPVAIADNSSFKGVIGCDETGFKGQADTPYVEEGWEFILAGGGLYNNLDYSFTAATPDGTEKVVKPTPGGGGRTLRAGLSVLKRFIQTFDFVKMSPDDNIHKANSAKDITVRALSEPGQQYAVYIRGRTQATLGINLPKGEYKVVWMNTKTGKQIKSGKLSHAGGLVDLISPSYNVDIALSIKAVQGD
ncbi:MAG: cellulase family glycosylhydrolase [Armatimonadota bacterium]